MKDEDMMMYVMGGGGKSSAPTPGAATSMPGAPSTKKCTSGEHKGYEFMCPGGAEYCSDDSKQQCYGKSPPFPWVKPPASSKPTYMPPNVSIEAELCLKIDDSICALKSQVCYMEPDSKMCHAMGIMCPRDMKDGYY